MNDAGGMRRCQGVGDAGSVTEGLAEWDALDRNDPIQRFAGKVFHHQEAAAIGSADIEHAHNVRVVQR
jgi:hypothetical protein